MVPDSYAVGIDHPTIVPTDLEDEGDGEHMGRPGTGDDPHADR